MDEMSQDFENKDCAPEKSEGLPDGSDPILPVVAPPELKIDPKKKKKQSPRIPEPVRSLPFEIELGEESPLPIIFAHPEFGIEVPRIAAPELSAQAISRIDETLEKFQDILQSCSDLNALTEHLLEKLIHEAGFQRTALLMVSHERREAIAIATKGEGAEEGSTHIIKNELSPLLRQSFTIQSFDRRGSETSPFGSQAYALAPLDTNTERPMALYADAGDNVLIGFEARRIFRGVVQLANQRLAEIHATP